MAENFEKLGQSVYQYISPENPECHASAEMKADFFEDGFIVVRNLFQSSEIDKIMQAVETSDHFLAASYGLADREDFRCYQSLWADPPCDDILGLATKTVKVAGVAEELLDKGEIYMYNACINMKQAQTGGAFLWHQDYGYWYNNGCLFPHMLDCFIALTKSDRENGGLEVLRKSNHVGRIDHWIQASQMSADPERVALLEKVLEHVYCDLKPGDAVFFHVNTLHTSKANLSDMRRWGFVIGFNAKHNSPDVDHYCACYTEPMVKAPADAVAKCQDLSLQKRNYIDPKTNRNFKYEDEEILG